MGGAMQTENQFYTLGLDIGIASVGWCVLGENRIIDLGVRAFDKAETAKEGESLNLARRSARLMRRRLFRRAWRLKKLARRLKQFGLISNCNVLQETGPAIGSPWQLRVEGLDRLLTNEEWARVIYHLCKHRGFHWTSKAEEKKADADGKSEGGKVKQGLAGTAKLMKENGYRSTAKLMKENGYRSAAEMVLAEFPEAQRNKAGDYGKALSRVLLGDELAQLFQRQRELGNLKATADLEAAVLGNGDRKSGLFWAQKPALAGDDLLKMLGKCTFEKSEYRAPKASFTAERHVWLTRLNNLRIILDGETRSLNNEERRLALPLPYQQAGDFTYKQLRAALVKNGKLPESFCFAGLAYPSARQKTEDKAKDPESAVLVKLPGWQELRSTLKKAGLETEWEGMAGAATGGNPELLDQVAWVLSVYKDDEEVEAELRKLPLPGGQAMIDALNEIRFDKFHALSLATLRNIVPHMDAGLRYDEACERAGYHHSQLHVVGAGESKFLPPLYVRRDKDGRMVFNEDLDIPRNPVVLRALNQARKVVNAIIRRYGSPAAVHIEMARDLSRNFDERNKIRKDQEDFRDRNEKDKAQFAETFGIVGAPKGGDFEKFRLYREQQGKCAYSVEPIDLHRLLEPGYVEVDHALPYSRSFDDSKNNKVLVLAKENRDKGNRTPYEYLGGAEDSPRWHRFVQFVENNKIYRQAKRSRLLRKNFGKEEAGEFKERNLNDTRYICRFFKNYVERYLQLAEGSEAKRCVVLSGQLTAFLRARWGLNKVRSDSDRHHALDAAVVAACSHGMVKRLADYSRHKELEKVREGFVDMETGEIVNPAMYQQLRQHFPEPWSHFREELRIRLGMADGIKDDPAQLRVAIEALGTYPQEALDELRPLFVSRAPQRRKGGAIHEDTIRSAKLLDEGKSYVKTPLQKLKLANLSNIVGASYSRNSPLITLLRERLEMHGDDGKKAFAEPVYKPSKNGTGSLVKAVKLASTQKGGMFVRGGVAEMGEMHHVDVYKSGNRYLIEPAYVASLEKRIKPTNLPEDSVFLFSLCKNDFVKICLGNVAHDGYFVMYESDGRLTLRAHDQPKPDKAYFRKGIGGASRIEKFHVDVLGNIYPAPLEPRRGLA
ncbi:MAG: type II CRISPR RNA-guided endonuclease Cas9 [Rhodocyclaceae bacterium]|nr:type II CRISPR RNA-guided endonuclease Cas9 [Rhodocyclaceae bacterium]